MYERSTDHRGSKEGEEVHTTTKASSTQGMGAQWQWDRDCPQVSNSSPHPISLAEGPGARSRGLSEREAAPGGCQGKGVGRGEPEIEGSPCHSDPGADVAKKRMNLV